MSYPNPNYIPSIEPIGTGKSKWWWFDSTYERLFRCSAAHDACYELKAMGYLWHADSRDADKLWARLYDEEFDKAKWYEKYAAKAFKPIAMYLMARHGKDNWPKHSIYRRTKWYLVREELLKWWDRAAPKEATLLQQGQMLADIKHRYWRYD